MRTIVSMLNSPVGSRVRVRCALATLSACVGLAVPAAAGALTVSKWEAGTCTQSNCTDAGPHSAFYTQAAGHPDYGITDFEFAYKESGLLGAKEPDGKVKDVRVDLPPGLATNPEATTALCTESQLNADDHGCPAGSQVGEDEATGTANVYKELGLSDTVTEHFPVYNMVRKAGQPARFGVEINSSTLEALALLGFHLQGHAYLEGGISWHAEPETSESSGVTSGDYHEFFKIPDIPEQPEIVESRLIFWGVPQSHTGVGAPTAFITLPSVCAGNPITHLHVDSYEDPGAFQAYDNETPVPVSGCNGLAFNPTLSLAAETSQSDQPDGVSADLHVPQLLGEPSKPNSPDLQNAEITLPEGMTLNPAAAQGLEGCSSEQFGAGGCPAASQVGTFAANAPGLPNGSLAGGVYVGAPEAGANAESGGEFRIFLLGEAPQYGVGLRLEGRIKANLSSGRLTTTFADAPQVPFEDLTLHLRGGARAPLANPLACGQAQPAATITPYGGSAVAAAAQGFVVDGNGSGGPCAAPLPFSLAQSLTPQSPADAGAYDPVTFNLTRGSGQQYVSKIATTLPRGLVGAIPSVPLCKEPEAASGHCPATSQVGTVTVAAGAGGEPYVLSGRAYLTGPYGSAPYGLSIVVPAVAGPYDFGEIVTRAGITVGLYDGRVTVTSELPTIVEGVPLRLQEINVDANRKNFIINPTNCGPLASESVLNSTLGASDLLSSPFQVGDCGALAFKPIVKLSTRGRPTKARGASLEVSISQPAGEANIGEMQLQLPKQLPSRLTTLQKACVAASFEAGPPPGHCKSTALVGSVTVTTPVLPGQLKGSAYLISHGGEAFPDLDLIVQGDGVEVVLVGHTHISGSGITTSTFEGLPDVPVSSIKVSLPMGPNSALATDGRLCRTTLLAPTTLISQSAVKLTEPTKIKAVDCPLEVLSRKRRGARLTIRMWAPEAGRLTLAGRGFKRVSVRVNKARAVKLNVHLTGAGLAALHAHGGRARKPKLRVGFKPKAGHNTSAVSIVLR